MEPKRKPYYGKRAMKMVALYVPPELWGKIGEKASQLSTEAGRKISKADVVRAAIDRLLKEI